MKKIVLFCIVCLLLVGCSAKKDSFFRRTYHETTAKFNPLFNGTEALRFGRLDIENNYQDNYWVQLRVAPYQLPDVYADEPQTNALFDRAEEKAILTVQKHSMLIDGEQRNKQIAKAYLLLGQARYFNGRYLPAIEAFSYLIKNMPQAEQAKEAELWRAKTYLELEQYPRATRELQNLSVNDVLTQEQYAIAQATLADAYLLEDQDTLATRPLTLALATEKSTQLRGRYAYLLGQVYEKLSYADSAIVAYQQVLDLNRRIPRELWIHARLAQLKNNLPNNDETHTAYKRLLRSDEDRRFRDKIHYFYGIYQLKGADTLLAEEHLNASLKTNTQDNYLKSLIYDQLADNRIDQIAYVAAGAYLDSTLQNLDNKSRRYRKLERKRKKLDDIIAYETTIVATDSLLQLIHMSAEEQLAVAENLVTQLKEKRAKEAAQAKRQDANTTSGSGTFYFYNRRELERGKQLFKRMWGEIALTDNWKYQPTDALSAEQVSDSLSVDTPQLDPELDPKTYLALSPEPEAADSLRLVQHEAYFQAGIAYKEQFAVAEKAIDRLTTLLSKDITARYEVPALYHLYELYAQTGSTAEQKEVKQRIFSAFPESDYAKMLRNPEALAQNKAQNYIEFAAAQKQFKQQAYQEVIALSEEKIPLFTDKELQADWALLRAKSLGRLDGLNAYKEALTTLVQTYPKTSAGQEAKTYLNRFDIYNNEDPGDNDTAKLVFVRDASEHKRTESDQEWLDKWIEEQKIETQLTTSIDVFDRSTETLVVHGFSSEASATESRRLIRGMNPDLFSSENIVILASHYRNALISKQLDSDTNN
jgi:tetratricopeptide (TPR) repeat protein